MAYLGKHPDATAAHIEKDCQISISTINWELQNYRVGNCAEPRYETTGWGETPDGRGAKTWRLAAEPLASAKRRLKAAVQKIGGVLAKHPSLAGEAATWVLAVAKRAEEGKGRKGKRAD
jgi:hypothetical protein